MSNVPMTRPDEMLAFHGPEGAPLFGGNAFLGLEGGRILFSNGTHFSVSADGGVTWSEPYPGLDENGDATHARQRLAGTLSPAAPSAWPQSAFATGNFAHLRVADGFQALGR